MVIRHIVVNTVGPKYAYVQQRYARIFVHISEIQKNSLPFALFSFSKILHCSLVQIVFWT